MHHVKVIPKLNSENDPNVQRIVQAIEATVQQCADEQVGWITSDSLLDYRVFIAVGGDGTMLEAMRQASVYNGYALGINLGRVGFLTDFTATSVDDLVSTIRGLFSGDLAYTIERRTLIQSWPNETPDRPLTAGNEVSLSHESSDSMICYKLTIGGMNAGIHRANSIMVASATGSTAYSLSAGGALMMPDMRSLQIVPVAPLTLTSRPIIVSSRMEIEIEAWGGPITVRNDGQRLPMVNPTQVYTKESPFKYTVIAHPTPADIVHLEGWNYFDILTQKLGWQKE